jgi:hypothetical protein
MKKTNRLLPHRLSTIGFAMLVLLGLPTLSQADDAVKRWVHGSWVNVRAGAAADSAVIAHVSTNTVVSVMSQNNKSCEISWGNDQHGFIACKFLGEAPLTLAEVANPTSADGTGTANPSYSPPRAFWIAPSMDALFYAGAHFKQSLLTAQQLELENSNGIVAGSNTPPRLVRYPVPEFEAMKALLAKGIVASAERDPPLLSCAQMQQIKKTVSLGKSDKYTNSYPEWNYPHLENFPHVYPMVSDCRVPELPKLQLPQIRPSLFKDSKEIAPGSADIERISAHFGIVERGRVTGMPKWELDYDTMRYTGAWDIGQYELTLEKPLVEHVIGRTGLVGAYQWTQTLRQTPFGPSGGCDSRLRSRGAGKQLLPGYPGIKDTLLWFQSPIALPFQKAKITSRSEVLPETTKNINGNGIKRAIIYEIDLNGDGIADFVQWDLWASDEITGPEAFLTLRTVFVNINGEWFPFEQDFTAECT